MAKRDKGIMRHEALYPLSHHHHHALVMALKLKRAGTKKSKHTTDELKKELDVFWKKDGNQHFRDEEEIVLPVYAKYADMNHPEIIEMLLEHVTVRSLVHQILNRKDDSTSVMNELGQLLDTHVRREERIVFPMIEKALPEEELQHLRPYLHTPED